jgi:hypothetical protein
VSSLIILSATPVQLASVDGSVPISVFGAWIVNPPYTLVGHVIAPAGGRDERQYLYLPAERPKRQAQPFFAVVQSTDHGQTWQLGVPQGRALLHTAEELSGYEWIRSPRPRADTGPRVAVVRDALWRASTRQSVRRIVITTRPGDSTQNAFAVAGVGA